MVEIRAYQEEFLDKQVEIGTKVIGEWTFGAQTGKEQLQRTYSQEGFDPETRLYAFEEDEMVGFLPASIQDTEESEAVIARLELPLVLPGYEEVREELFNHALEVLKSKGVEIVRTRAGSDWGYTPEFASEKGFERKDHILRRATYDLSNWELKDTELNVVEFNFNQHKEIIRRMYEKFYPNVPKEAIDNVMIQLENNTGVHFITHKLVLDEDGEIEGRLTAYKNTEEDENVLLGSMISFETDNQSEVEQTLLTSVMNELKALEVDEVLVNLSGQNINADDKFATLGLEFTPALSYYDLKITE